MPHLQWFCLLLCVGERRMQLREVADDVSQSLLVVVPLGDPSPENELSTQSLSYRRQVLLHLLCTGIAVSEQNIALVIVPEFVDRVRHSTALPVKER